MNSIFFLQYKNTPCSFLTVDVAKALNSWVYCSFCNASLFLLPSKPLTFRLQNFYFSFSTIFTFPCQNFYFSPSITFTFYLQKLPLFYWYQVYLQVEMFSCPSHVLSVIKINFHWSINVEIKSSKYPDKIKKYQNINTGNYHLGHHSLFHVIDHFFDDRKTFGLYSFAKLA